MSAKQAPGASSTVTVTGQASAEGPEKQDNENAEPKPGSSKGRVLILKLKAQQEGSAEDQDKAITWSEDVVDNEFMDKKSSKGASSVAAVEVLVVVLGGTKVVGAS